MQEPWFKEKELSLFLQNILKRRKAFKKKVMHFDASKVVEIENGFERERLEVSFGLSGPTSGPSLHLTYWPDRILSVDARERTKSRLIWSWEKRGRLLGNVDGKKLNHCIEETLFVITTTTDASRSTELDNIWNDTLSSDLRAID